MDREPTVYVCATHLCWIFAMPELVDFLVYPADASVEGWTREELQQ